MNGRPFGAAAAIVLGAALTTGSARPPVKRPVHVRQPGAFRSAPVLESSGATKSRSHPGLFWTLNDSGNPATLFLVDTTGVIRGLVRLPVPNVDWEALTSGPCGDGRWCLYVADIGDNRAVRPTVVIYRVPEPDDGALQRTIARPTAALAVRYANGPRDAEAVVVTRNGDLAIISKGRQGPVTAYWIPKEAWAAGRFEAKSFWTLPISTSLLLASLVTDAALSPDETWLAVRTYREIHLFTRTNPASRLPDQLTATCDIAGLEPQGEGITWWDDHTLLLTSEIEGRNPGPITLLECPVP